MAVVGAAAIGAAGTLGAAAITSSGGGGGGGGIGAFPTTNLFTGGFDFNTQIDQDGFLQNTVVRNKSTPGFLALNERFPRILGDIDNLRGQLNPGFGALTNAGVAAINNNRTRAIGDLRESLNRRRVLGSSFANDALARVDAEFAQREAEFRSQTALQELDAFNALIKDEFNFIQTELQRDLAESQFAANVQLGIIGTLTGAANAAAARVDDGRSALGSAAGTIAGEFFGPAISAGGERFANLFGSGSTSSPQSFNVGGPSQALTIGNGIIP